MIQGPQARFVNQNRLQFEHQSHQQMPTGIIDISHKMFIRGNNADYQLQT